MRKQEERILKHILLPPPKVGDLIRFKYGKVSWFVVGINHYRQEIVLRRIVYSKIGSFVEHRTISLHSQKWNEMEIVGRRE